jgi:signal transduction histidine kinase
MKSIRAQLQLNYIAVAALALLLVLAVMWINSADRPREEFFSVDLEQIGEDYLFGGLEYAFEDPAFTRDDAIELLDSNYTVMDTVNSRTPVGYTYSQQEFNEMISLSEEDTYFTWYPENGDGSFLLIRLAPLEDYYDTLILFSVIATLLFIALVYLFARHTGKRIIGPIKKLTEGANALENGDLDYRIHFEGNNELVSLRDAFNSMARKLAEETKRREHIEENRKALIRNISHDIKTPLTNIIGYAQTLMSPQKQREEDIRNALKVILKNGVTAMRWSASCLNSRNWIWTRTPWTCMSRTSWSCFGSRSSIISLNLNSGRSITPSTSRKKGSGCR